MIDLLTKTEVAKEIDIHPKTINNWLRDGYLKPYIVWKKYPKMKLKKIAMISLQEALLVKEYKGL